MSDKKPQKVYLGVGMLGNVDASKSTTLGMLITGQKDDGNGKLRSLISRHPHEIKSGRTSDTAYHTGVFGDNRITFVDLAGHEKYLKTTIAGLGIVIPDLLLLCVDRYAPTYKMTKEHMGLAIRMKIPFVILMTKVDLYDKETTNDSLSLLSKVIKKSSSRGVTEVKTIEDVDAVVSSYTSLASVPAFRISNVTHEGVNLLRNFLSRITKCSTSTFVHAKKFMTDRCYKVKGIGLVVSGFNGGRSISVGDKLYINGDTEAFVRSIHDDFRNEVKTLPENTRGCLAIRTSVERVPPGSVLSFQPHQLVDGFVARIEILSNHSTSITKGYQTVIHCGPVRRTASVSTEGEVVFRGGMKGPLSFKFITPAYVEVGQSIFFREGRVIGDGVITEVILVEKATGNSPRLR